MEKIDGFKSIELRDAINKHILAMLKRSLDAMHDLKFIHMKVEEKTPWLWENGNQEGLEKGSRPATDILTEDSEGFQECLNFFLNEDFQIPKEGGLVPLEVYLFTGIRYYQKRLADDGFYLMSDLPELFTADERMSDLFSIIKGLAQGSISVVNNHARIKKSNETIKKTAINYEQQTVQALKKIKDTSERTITDWARQIEQAYPNGVKIQTIIDTIRTHYGKNLTKPPRAKYTIMEILS